MYRQALRELEGRWSALKGLVAERRIAEVTLLSSVENDGFEHKLYDKLRELCEFYQIADWLKEQIGDLTVEKRAELDEQYWCTQMLKAAATDALSSGRISAKTWNNVSTFPEPLRAKLYVELHALQTRGPTALQAFLEPEIQLPEFPPLPSLMDTLLKEANDAVDSHEHALLSGREDTDLGDVLEVNTNRRLHSALH